MDLLQPMFSPAFMPHGHCYLWTPGVLWGHVISDAVIALSYFSIPVVLVVLVRRRRDLAFSGIFMLFALFIVACGAGHLIDIWNVWHADYGWSAIVRVTTALASIGTAVVLWPLLPKALAIPSPQELEEEIVERRRAESLLLESRSNLEERVLERTQELESFGRLATDREDQMIMLKRRINDLCAELERPPEHDLTFLTDGPRSLTPLERDK